jgi:AcrR family transcriptional regulator
MERLPPGRHGLPRDVVAQNQRDRLIAAITDSLYEQGYEKSTVSSIGRRARVSKADFYRHFASKEECLLAAYDAAVERLREEVLLVCADRGDWAQGVCVALALLLASLASEPANASLVLVGGLRGGRPVYDRFQEAVQRFVPYLRNGAPAGAGGSRPPEAVDEAVVGGIVSLLGQHVLAGETERLVEFFPEIAEFALTPYLGPAEARRIISAR